jgi:dolichyl-phosphate beta-glucosyltransferase
MTSLSVVLPAYNEGKRLPPTLMALAEANECGALAPLTLVEVLVVDDGSTDDTILAAQSFSGRLPLRIEQLPQNRGKGAAVRQGMLTATGDVVAFYDADGATPPAEIGHLGRILLEQSGDIAIGSRVLLQADVHMQWHRRLIGRIYHTLCQQLVPGIHDAACGCKLFRREVAQRLFRLQTIDRFAFDIEILALALAHGDRVLEVPVHWTAIPDSRLHLVRDGWDMLGCVLRLRRERQRFKQIA